MAFEQELRGYLQGLEQETSEHARSSLRHIDEHELHRHLLDRLRELEGGFSAEAFRRVESLFSEWPGRLARFARFLEALPRQIAPVDREGALAFARRVLDRATIGSGVEVTLVDRLELQRIVDLFASRDATMEAYTVENQLVRMDDPGRMQITSLGRTLLRLRGKDAIRWLLTLEVLQNTGNSDCWHASRGLLADAVAAGIEENFGGFDHSEQTLERLAVLGVLAAERGSGPDYRIVRYRAAAAMRDVIEAVLHPGPWHTAVRALLEDERSEVLPRSLSNAAEATIEQTKLIVHEVRNALIPVRHDIEALRTLAVEPAQQQRIAAAKQGVVRVLDFVDAMAQASELIVEPSTLCDIGAVVEEALGWVDVERRVERRVVGATASLRAPRARLARALSNVISNALQATSAGQPVRLSIERAGNLVRVAMDDGGPGVPIDHRARIFLEGVTMRADGTGSGFGLAFARRVVEDALHGKIWCESSDLGGARFVIEVPQADD